MSMRDIWVMKAIERIEIENNHIRGDSEPKLRKEWRKWTRQTQGS